MAAQVRRGQVVTVALSGGIDSVVLLDLLRTAARTIGFRLRALHVNHGLSTNARAWERFCREHCRRRRVPFQAVRVTVAGGGSNVEAEARAARYRAFAEHGSKLVALAHNQNDQAETLLLHLLRGSGARGLAAMPRVRRLSIEDDPGRPHGARLIRPLLGVARSAIEAHARRRRLHWVDDESNADPRFERNFLRARILPVLEARFPGCHGRLARSAAHLAEAAELLEQLAALDCAQVVEDDRLHAGRLMALGDARAANALRLFLSRRGELPPSTVRTRELLRQLGSPRRDAQPAVALATGSLQRFRGWIELVPAARVDHAVTERIWSGESSVRLADGQLQVSKAIGTGVSVRRLQSGQVTIRTRRGGERMRLEAGRPSRTLKNLLQEANVAPWRRARMPLVFCGERLVWAAEVGIASEFRAGAGEAGLHFAWREPAKTAARMR